MRADLFRYQKSVVEGEASRVTESHVPREMTVTQSRSISLLN